MTATIAREGDRVDFMFGEQSLIGTVVDVIEGARHRAGQFEHQYVIESQNQQYRVGESDVATP